MSLVLPNKLSGGKHTAKERKRTSDARGDPVPGLGRQATIEEIPEEEHCAADAQTKPHDAQQARYRVYQADDPMLEPDEYGAELTKDARVWKVYVKEADRWDAELVDGWNKSLDVILVFAALFSAVSTTFVIESSGMLKQDPNDVSAAALIVISQALVALAGNSSVDLLTLSLPYQSAAPFTPPHNAVVVNTLWYLSLATSIATSFLAMLAKDWCHSFATGRSGHPWDQAQRRQRKWMMIEKWKMQELIVVLPSLIHLSLLLFAIGLCLYVWDLNTTTAIPVICIAGAAFLFYVWSSVIASMVKHFPYTTIVSTLLRSKAVSGPLCVLMAYLGVSLRSMARVVLFSVALIPFLLAITACLPLAAIDTLLGRRFWKSGSYWHHACDKLEDWYQETAYLSKIDNFNDTIIGLSRTWIVDAGKLLIDMLFKSHNNDHTVSYSLYWLIKHCETPSSVAVALQAIAGATRKIPKDPLEECKSSNEILKRLVSSPSGPKAAQEASLYARALRFLVSSTSSDLQQNESSSGEKQDVAVMIWDLKLKNEKELVNLISDGRFVATEQNMEALRIGASAASYALRMLQGDDQDARATMDRIITLIFDSQELHPAAFRSLINGAKLLGSCSSISWSWVDSFRQRSDPCHSADPDDGPEHNAGVMLKELLATLREAVMAQYSFRKTHNSESRSATELSAYTYLHQALGPLTPESQSERDIQIKLSWVRCYEMVSNPTHYMLDPESAEVASVKTWCDDYLRASDPVLSSETPAFVAAISRVYETVAPHDTKRKCLPEAVYVILVWAASGPQSEEQRAACMDVLSRFSFPSLSTELVQYVTQVGNHSTNRLVEWLARRAKYGDDPVSKHFSATQLWLLLHLVGDSTTSTQKCLSQLLEDEGRLEIKTKGFDQVKKDLEERILHYYNADRLDTYSARIIECIHKSSGTQPDDHTKAIMDQKLKDVPQSHRGLKQLIDDRTTHPAPDPALIPLPQSIPSSRAPSVMAEPETISHEPEERWDVDHVSIEIVPSSPAQDESRACPNV
ncbi:hypothetical protein RSOLAG1IB_10709 [Rhizoctonia solani AG-1 IB]|uniref:DUF6535 domain-containing protein n=1 Tax=Thanatephorus cucumeris (strain AG1-IB / isolate 7/3/14) TaxID=1108050 RepID=A0A0B7G4E3_THACB|nr:hypothetical protein RSOLAG1IB_10709 [Rhizoctonia solani AG-1 IB]